MFKNVFLLNLFYLFVIKVRYYITVHVNYDVMQHCQGKPQRLFAVPTCRVSNFIIITKYQVQKQPKQIFKYIQNILAAVCLSSACSPAFYMLPYINFYTVKNDRSR